MAPKEIPKSRGRQARPPPDGGEATKPEMREAVAEILAVNPEAVQRVLMDWFQFHCRERVSAPMGCWRCPEGVHCTPEEYPQATFYWPAADRLPRAETLRGRGDVFPGGAYRQVQTLLMHRVAAMATARRQPAGDEHASHRCHVRKCFNPHHLLFEHRQLNQQRKGCSGTLRISGLPGGVRYLVVCPHHPPCLNMQDVDVAQAVVLDNTPVVTDVFQRHGRYAALWDRARSADDPVVLSSGESHSSGTSGSSDGHSDGEVEPPAAKKARKGE